MIRPKLCWCSFPLVFLITSALVAGSESGSIDNALSPQEKGAGWILLFNGENLSGWRTSGDLSSKVPVDDHAINPHGCGNYMMVHEQTWSDFVLALDFKISKGCNSGVFVRTFPLTPPR